MSRTARNLPAGEIPDPLVKLMIADLYETDGARPASVIFEELAAQLELHSRDPRLDRCRRLLEEIDGLESRIRKGDDPSVRTAGANALEIDALLRSLSKELGRS